MVSFTAVPPLASVTVTLYVPAAKPVMVESVRLFDHKTLYGFTPPVIETPAPPFVPPVQLTFESKRMLNSIEFGSLIVTWSTAVHPFPSVMVTE